MKKTRTTEVLAQGIYKDAHGITILIRPKGMKPIRERWPLNDANGRPYTRRNNGELVIRRFQLLEDIKAGRLGGDRGAPGTLKFAIATFLDARPKTASTRNADYHHGLKCWTESALATMQVLAIRKADIVPELDAMTRDGYAPSTVNHRKRMLGDVLRVELEKEQRKRRLVNGASDDDLIVPTDLIPIVPQKKLEVRGMDMDLVELILGVMTDRGNARRGERQPTFNATKIRLGVMAWTGMAPASLLRCTRDSISYAREEIQLPERKKGKGVPAVWVPVLPLGIGWIRKFDAAKLWGKKFSLATMRDGWTLAVKKKRAELKAAAEKPDATEAQIALYERFQNQVPLNSRPYDVRHSYLTDWLRRTGDRTAVQTIAQHADGRMLDRYTKGAVPERVTSAMEKMREHYDPKPAATVLQLVKK